MFTTPLSIRADTSALYDDPSVTDAEARPFAVFTTSGKLSTRAKLLQRRWDGCSKNLCTQWQIVNYVSALLLATLVTMLQDTVVSSNRIAQPLATTSFLCALASLCWGVACHIHMSKTRSPLEARSWILNAIRLRRCVWWNVEIMFSLPMAWLLWSAALFCLAFVVSYTLNVNIPGLPQVLSQVPGIVVICTWTTQAVLVVWTLARLGHRQGVAADGKQPIEV